MSIVVGWRHRDGTGGTISGRAPFPLVVDWGLETLSTHSYDGGGGGVGIRFDEKRFDNVTYKPSAGAVPFELSSTNLALMLNFERVSLGTYPLVVWTASIADTGAYWYNSTGIRGKPVAVRLNNIAIVEGTIGSLANGQWAWGDADGIGGNRVYVQSALTTPTVEVIYGDGTHLRIESIAGAITENNFEVLDKIDNDTIQLVVDLHPAGNLTDVTIYQHVNPVLHLKYRHVATAGTIEPITNNVTRPGCQAPDETRGWGPIWPYVIKEGAGTCVITTYINDYANGDTEVSSTITYTETDWSAETALYVDSVAGSDANNGLSSGAPKATWGAAIELLRTTAAPATLYVKKNSAFTLAADVNNWINKTGDRRIKNYDTGNIPTIACANFFALRGVTTFSTDLRISDLILTSSVDFPIFAKSCLVRVNITGANGRIAYYTSGMNGLSIADSIMWDCVGSSTGTTYTIFGGTDSNTTSLRTAIMGCILNSISSGESLVRIQRQNSVYANNKMTSGGIVNKDCLRMGCTNILCKNIFVHANWLQVGSGDSQAMDLFVDGSLVPSHKDILISQNYIENLGSGTATKIGLQLNNSQNVRVENNIFNNFLRTITCSTGRQVNIEMINNTIYNSASGAGTHMIIAGIGGVGSAIQNARLINNIASFPDCANNAVFVMVDGAFESKTLIKIHKCLINMLLSVPGGIIRIDGDNDTIADWESYSGADLIGGSGGSAVDPLFVDAPGQNFDLDVASPCLVASYFVPSVYYDYRGFIPVAGGRNDIGAYQRNGVFESDPAASAIPVLQAQTRRRRMR